MNMKTTPKAVAAGIALLSLVSLVGLGCSKKVSNTLLPNEPPVIRLSHAPIDQSDTTFYAFRMNWVGYDTDGRVDHFIYAVDPTDQQLQSDAVPDTSWHATNKNEQIFFFKAGDYNGRKENGRAFATGGHVFAVRAIDDRGAMSEPVYRAF